MLLIDEGHGASQSGLQGVICGKDPGGVFQWAALGHRLSDDRSDA